MIRYIELTRGYKTKVDLDTYNWAKAYIWNAHICKKGTQADGTTLVYAYRSEKGKKIYLHKELLKHASQEGKVVDHINGITLDNTRANLQIITHRQNITKSKKNKNRTSTDYRGVYYRRGKWEVKLRVNGISIWGGTFRNKNDAALKYNELATEYNGKFAVLNKVVPIDRCILVELESSPDPTNVGS